MKNRVTLLAVWSSYSARPPAREMWSTEHPPPFLPPGGGASPFLLFFALYAILLNRKNLIFLYRRSVLNCWFVPLTVNFRIPDTQVTAG